MQDTHRSRGALDDGGDAGANQHAQDGVLKGSEELSKGRAVLKGSHSGLHGEHTLEEDTEAQEDLTDDLALGALGDHEDQDTYNGDQGSQGAGLDEAQQEAGAFAVFQIAQTEDLTGDGGTDVGAHDDAHSRAELEDTGVNHTDHDNGSGRGALDGCGNGSAQKHAEENVAGELFQRFFHTAAGNLFQAAAQHTHAVEEQCQAAAQRDQTQNTHK